MNFKQIQELCKVKLKDNETEMKIQESQQSIIQSQMLDMFKDNFAKMVSYQISLPYLSTCMFYAELVNGLRNRSQ